MNKTKQKKKNQPPEGGWWREKKPRNTVAEKLRAVRLHFLEEGFSKSILGNERVLERAASSLRQADGHPIGGDHWGVDRGNSDDPRKIAKTLPSDSGCQGGVIECWDYE